MTTGLVGLIANGSAVITPSYLGLTAPVTITVTPAVPAYLPIAGDVIRFDTRAGQANSIQAAGVNTLALAKAQFPDGLFDLAPPRWTNNYDGANTHAFCHDSVGFADSTITQAITSNAAAQKINVTWTGNAFSAMTLSKVIGIGHLSANVEAVTCSAFDATSITAVFTKNHSIGDAVAVCRDMGTGELMTYLTPAYYSGTARPRHFFFAFKHRMGKTASDASGLGTNDVMQLYNGYCDGTQNYLISGTGPGSNAGRKLWLVPREIKDGGGLDRTGYLWGGINGASANPFADTDSCSYGTSPVAYQNYGSPSPSINPSTQVAQVVTRTFELSPETSLNAADGFINAWDTVSGVTTQIMALTGLRIGPESFDRLQTVLTFNSIRVACTEYTWDWMCWERPWVGVVPASQTTAPVFVSSTPTSVTLTIPVPASAPDTARIYVNGTNIGVSFTYAFQTSTKLGTDIALVGGDAGTNKTITLTGISSGTYTGVSVTFGKNSKFGLLSQGLATMTVA